ncbi:MAG: DUF3048 domain-containing protein [Herpetosiphonaceae bacterium]|nr:DUF3048 domain-containing protein [Herpetosiphonaceae bacterium]
MAAPTVAPTNPTSVAAVPSTQPSSTALPVVVVPTGVPTSATTAAPATTATPTIITTNGGRPALARGALTKRPLMAMIDNHPDAYPQTGLDEAALVFEALAEYGVTRYMAIYAPEIKPVEGNIGPIRSARLYFVQWAMGFQAVYTHAGGSPAGLERLTSDDNTLVIDIDLVTLEDRGIFDYSRRDRNRLAPHNLYSSQPEIERYVADRAAASADADVSEVGYLFAADNPALGRANPVNRLRYYFLYPEAFVRWTYDSTTNQYFRFRGQTPHIDAVSGEQLSFKSVTVMEVQEAPIAGDPKGRIDQVVISEGSALVFANGTQIAATWRKDSEIGPLRFYDQQDAEIVFPAGPIWVAAVPSLSNVTTSE